MYFLDFTFKEWSRKVPYIFILNQNNSWNLTSYFEHEKYFTPYNCWDTFYSILNIFVNEKYRNPFRKYIYFCHITAWIRFLRKMLLLIYYNDIKHARVVLLLNTRHPKMWVSNSKNQFMTACEMVVKKFAWFETENILKSYFFLREDI